MKKFDCDGFLYDVQFGNFLKVSRGVYCYDNVLIKSYDLLTSNTGQLKYFYENISIFYLYFYKAVIERKNAKM